MSVIKIENLTFSYPSGYDNIFENVSFQIDTNWKTGFIGRNGRGKTTFLKLLQGKYDYSGKISSSVMFDYFPYTVPDKSLLTKDVICTNAEEWEIIRELSCLEVDAEVLYRPFNTLSNGEQTKVLLAALFLNEENFLLIDEPTNHLDAHAREVVSEYLRKKRGFILVSHDRCFLDGCVDHIISINKADIEIQAGNFSSWFTNFERNQEFERKQNVRLQTDIKRLQKSALRTSEWADAVEASKIGAVDKGYVGHKSAKMMKRAKCIEARQKKEIEEKSALLKNTEYASSLKLIPLPYHSETLVDFSSVAACYNGKQVFSPLSFCIKRGERIALEGKNGCGKSSLLKIICGQNIQYSGSVRIGSNLKISYVPQDTSHLTGTLLQLARQSGIDESLFLTVLHKMGFNKIQFEKDISDFSDGQKKKTLIAKSLCEKANLYVWDEPLNFIDIYSRIQIENLLKEFQPAMIFVEHDKAFRESIATRSIILLNGR